MKIRGTPRFDTSGGSALSSAKAPYGETPSWYLDPLVAAQKRQVHQVWIREATKGRPHDVVLKTDLFEEAYGDDRILNDLFPDTRLTIGIDVNARTLLTAARRGGADFRPVAGDVRRLPFPSGCADVVVSNSTLDHFETRKELDRSLDELARVLRPDGVLLVTLDNPLNPLYYFLRWVSRRGWTPFELGVTVSASTLRRLLIERGFQIENTRYLIHNPRGISTVLFIQLRKMLGRRATYPIRALLAAFACLEKLPTRSITGCFAAVSAVKRTGAAQWR